MYSLLILFYIIGLIYIAAIGPYYIMQYSKDPSFINLIKVIISLFLFAFFIYKLFDNNFSLISISLVLKVIPLIILSFISFYIIKEKKPTFNKLLSLFIIIFGLIFFILSE